MEPDRIVIRRAAPLRGEVWRVSVSPRAFGHALYLKLDDGRYEVIFGDLRSEAVTAERLRALEAK